MPTVNRHPTRESWLKAAADGLRPLFQAGGHPLPAVIKFPSTDHKHKQAGECGNGAALADGSGCIPMRADLAEPAAVLAELVRKLALAAGPTDEAGGLSFRAVAGAIGLQGARDRAKPGRVLAARLVVLANELGPLPSAKPDIERGATTRPKKQGTRLLKATCPDKECGYTVRVTSKWVREVGPPWCPKHGAMHVDMLPDEDGACEPEGG